MGFLFRIMSIKNIITYPPTHTPLCCMIMIRICLKRQSRKAYKIFLARPACVLIFASLHALEAGEENGIVFVVPVIAELRASWDSGQRYHDG